MNQRSKGTMLNYIYIILHALINLIYIPILLKYLGEDEFGLYQMIGSILSYLTVMESSLSAGVLRFYCKYYVKNDTKNMENVLGISQVIYLLISGLVIGLAAILYFNIHNIFSSTLNIYQVTEAKFILVLLVINIILNLMNYVYIAVINANEKFVFLKLLNIIMMILQPILVITLVKQIPYAITLVIIQLFLNMIVCLLRRYYVKKFIKAKIKIHKWDYDFIKNIMLFSLGILFSVIADQIFWKTDQIILGVMYGTHIVTLISLSSQIYTNYMSFGVSISSVFMPKITYLYEKEKNINQISLLFTKVGRIAYYILGLILTAFLLYGKEFISLWVGVQYVEAYIFSLIVMIPFTIDLIQNLALTILQVTNKYSFRSKVYFIISVINVFFTILLVKQIGPVGAVIATAISMIIGNGIIMNVYYKNAIGLDIKEFWKQILNISKYIILSLIIGGVLKIFSNCSSFVYLFFNLSVYTIIYCLFMYSFSFNDYEQGLVLGIINKMIRRVRYFNIKKAIEK